MCNYADDTTISLNTLIKRLDDDATIVIDWLRYNYMKLDPDKCHILISGYNHEVTLAKVGNVNVIESHKVTLLGIEIDSDLKFHNYISMICSKAAKQLNALSRQSHILPFRKRKSLMKAFIMSQYSYCPLVWMFCSRTLNTKINNIHYRGHYKLYTVTIIQLSKSSW